MTSSPWGEKIVAQARTYIGCLYRHRGRNRGGVDCVGLLVCVAHDLHIVDYDTEAYSRHENDRTRMLAPFYQFCERVMLADKLPGDILIFTTATQGHCGVFAGETMIHAHLKSKQVVEDPIGLWYPHPDPRVKLIAVFRAR